MQSIKGFISHSVKCTWNTKNWFNITCFSTFTQPLWMNVTPALMAEPMKKKKKMDPALLRVREDRKRRKLWKECRRLMKHQKQLKPLDETNIPYSLIDDRENRLRQKPILTAEILNKRADLLREWSSYRNERATLDFYMIDRMYRAQDKALQQLKLVSPRLYEEAIKIDETFLPLTINGPTFTPPIQDYDSPDGEYIDVTKKWEAPKITVVDTKKWGKKK